MIEDFKAARAKELKKGSKTKLVSPATVNRELNHTQEDPEHGR